AIKSGFLCNFKTVPQLQFFVRCVLRINHHALPRYELPRVWRERRGSVMGARYHRSAIVVRRGDGAETPADLKDRRCVVNQTNSNGGSNLLRAAMAAYPVLF